MPDLIAIGQGLSALKTLTDIGKTMVGLRDSAKLAETSFEFNHQLFSIQKSLMEAQQEQATMIKTICELEEENTRLKAWDGDAKSYELKAVASGVLAYMLKPDARGSEPPHWLCAQCFGDKKKSLLQLASGIGSMWAYKCPGCSIIVRVGPRLTPRWMD